MEDIVQDLCYGLRLLAKDRLFTFVVVATLGIGISANSAIFSVIYGILMRPLPFTHSDELVRIFSYNRLGKIGVSSWKDVDDWRQNAHSFSAIAVFSPSQDNVMGPNGPQKLDTADVSTGFFELLGVRPLVGRTFLPDDYGDTGENRVAILSEGFWKRQFAADPSVVGRLIEIDGHSSRVIGVVPDRFGTLVGPAQLWLAWHSADETRDDRHLPVIARLNEGISLEQANRELAALSSSLQQMYPTTNREVRVSAESLKETIVGNVKVILLTLFAASGLVLFIASGNVANLLLARMANRTHEINIRSALGATRYRLVQQLLTECLILAIVGGFVGLLLGWLAVKVLILMNPGDIPRLNETGLNAIVVVFTVLLSIVSTVLFGLTPALRSSASDPNSALQEFGRGISASRRGSRMRELLLVGELALSLVVLVGAGLLMRSFHRLISIDPGFNEQGLVTAAVSLNSHYDTLESRRLFYQELMQRLGSLPGTRSSALSTTLPLSGSGINHWWTFVTEGHSYTQDRRTAAQCRRVSPGYFRTMQIPLVAGRDFSDSDTEKAPPVIVVTQTMARKTWPNDNPIGKRLIFYPDRPPYEVVGVAGDIKRGGLDDNDDMAFYTPLAQSPSSILVIVARSSFPSGSLAGPIRSMVAGIDRSLAVADISTMQHFRDATLAKRNFILVIFSILAALAVILASIGTYGVTSYSVVERTREIGIRMALGATRGDVLILVIGQVARSAIYGIVLGVAAAYVTTRALQSYLFQISPRDPFVFVLTSLFLVILSLMACSAPALKAAMMGPMGALRFE